tara:strand:- start:413 stop:1618 length:1206 start_codon:yes stop_codon:yes gene_type:complete
MEYKCRFVGPSGGVHQDVFSASDEHELRKKLKKQGILVLGIKRKGFLGFLSALSKSADMPKSREFIVFNDELATLLSAGIPIVEALDILRHRIESSALKVVLDDVANRVRSGESLSEAFRNSSHQCSGVYIATLLAGEKSGNLENVIRRYARHEKLIVSVKSKALSAMIYPAILMLLSFVVVGIIVLNVVPAFSAFYAGLGSELPLMTRVIVSLSTLFSDYFLGFFVFAIASVLSFIYARKVPAARLIMDSALLRIPVIGAIVVKFNASQTARTLSTLLAGGTPLLTALEVVQGAAVNGLLAKKIGEVAKEVKEGSALSVALGSRNIFPAVGLKMVEVGETTGALKEMLESVSDFFDEEIQHSLDRLMTLLEPSLLILMGIVISAMLIALYMPLLQLGTLM